MAGLRSLSKPDVVSDDVLKRHVTTRHIDMNEILDNLGLFDLVWSSCALEHLGTPQAGLDFVTRTLDLLEPPMRFLSAWNPSGAVRILGCSGYDACF